MADLNDWNDLLAFKPPRRVQGDLTIRTGGRIQFLEEGAGDVTLDVFPIKVGRLPEGFDTPETLLSRIRKNLNEFVDTDITRFSFFDNNEAEKEKNERLWQSEKPLGTIFHLDISMASLNLEDATVMATSATSGKWIFSTVYTRRNGYHPVSGNREFGFISHGDRTFTFYTKGADRVSGLLELAGNKIGDVVLNGQTALWQSFQSKVERFVNDSGGKADSQRRVIKRQAFEG
jgi:hypothetical protein